MRRALRNFTGELEQSDRPLLAAVSVMLFVGVLAVYGAGSSGRLAAESLVAQHGPIIRHLVMVFIGVVGMLLAMRIDYRWWRQPTVVTSLLVLALLLVFVTRYFPNVVDGQQLARRWIRFGSVRIQPAELAKVAVCMFLAARLTAAPVVAAAGNRRLILTLLAGPGALALLLLMQPNYGNVLVLGLITAVVLWVTRAADTTLKRLMIAAPLAAVAAYLFVPKIHRRVGELISGWGGDSFGPHVDQALISIAGRGWLGAGPGGSHNKYSFLSEADTDFIFAILSEEWGMIGALAIIAALVTFIWRGYGIAARSADPFGRALAAGLTTGVAGYGLVNLAMTLGFLPVVGVPLPLVSVGGSAMITTLGAVGILLNIERNSRSYQTWKRRWDRGAAG